jgi:hypothetical protein
LILAEVPTNPPKFGPSDEPPKLGVDGRIVEGIISTYNADGVVNISPMGPIVDDSLDRLWLRPFRTSTTFQNLKREGAGVFHITDDVELFAQAAVGQPDPLPRLVPAKRVRGAIIADACRWFAFEIELLDDSAERTSIVARVVDRGVIRDFLGFNRAKHAVIEAAILATRVHLIDVDELRIEFERLAVPIQKTGAAAECGAFEFLRNYVNAAITRDSSV